MTSSKSSRRSNLIPSFSLPLFRTFTLSRSETKLSKSAPNSPRRKLQSKSTVELSRSYFQSEEALPQTPEIPGKQSKDGERVPSRLEKRRTRSWSNNFSLFKPTLTSPNVDTRQSSILRKPMGGMLPPTDPPPPPPSDRTAESNSISSETSGSVPTDITDYHQPDASKVPCPQYMPPVPPPGPPYSALDTPDIEISISSHVQPQREPPLPPPYDPVYTTLDTSETTPPQSLRSTTPSESSEETPEMRQPLEPIPENRPRSTSYSKRNDSLPAMGIKTRQTAPPLPAGAMSEPRGRSVSARIPSTIIDTSVTPRTVSSPISARPVSGISESPSRRKLRRSWMPGGRSRSNSVEVSNFVNLPAWVMTDDNQAEYNTSFLQNADKVPELWNESGTVLVFLYPKSTGCGPSFKVPEFTVSSSYIFMELIRSEFDALGRSGSRARSYGGRASLSVEDATRMMSPVSASDYSTDLCLYLPAPPPNLPGQPANSVGSMTAELDRLIAVRNLFAFLTGQPLVGTKSRPNTFQALLRISELLQEFCFSSPDGQTFGNAVDLSFGFYSDLHGLSDCRYSREHTVEALILGERMRSISLYNEAFAHAAGKYSAIKDLRLPLYEQIHPTTSQRLERAHLDLVNRQHNVNEQLEQFDFPSLFAGIANSTSTPELKHVRFKIWRNSFSKMRQFVLGHYKTAFGSWPPKASSKKNPFAESGLNRLVLKMLYSDLCALYDLLVDRTNLTSRVIDEVAEISSEADKMTTSALRNILSEFDRSRPPVLPPIPFDLPLMPSMTSILETYNSLSAKEQAKFDKRVKDHEVTLVLNKAYNYDTNSIKLPFLDQFKEFEFREAKGKTSQDIVDQRIGFWLFLYCVIQSLPTLVVDAPDLRFTEGVEYFLCEPPMGSPPWMDDKQVQKMWYEVAGGGGYVELSRDAVMFSTEAIYHRSHCWLVAKVWEDTGIAATLPAEPSALSPLAPPPPIFPGTEGMLNSPALLSGQSTPSPPPGSPQLSLRTRNLSPTGRRASTAYRSSIVMGLEPLPLEPPSAFAHHQRSSSLGPQSSISRLNGRSVSVGNLAAMNYQFSQSSRSGSPAPSSAIASGATFDDILGGEPEKKTGSKKKGRFF